MDITLGKSCPRKKKVAGGKAIFRMKINGKVKRSASFPYQVSQRLKKVLLPTGEITNEGRSTRKVSLCKTAFVIV